MNQITYFIRSGCRWIKVTTSVAQWARLPHVVGSLSCKATGLLLLGALTGSAPSKVPPAATGQPRAMGHVASAPSTSPSEDLGSAFMFPPAANDADDDKMVDGGTMAGFGGAVIGSLSGLGTAMAPLGTVSPDVPSSPILLAEKALPDAEAAMPPVEGSSRNIPVTPPALITPDETITPLTTTPMVVSEPKTLILLGLAIAALAGSRHIARRKRIDPASAAGAGRIAPADIPAWASAPASRRETEALKD